MNHNLTEKEQALYDAICKGMDEPGCGWLSELRFGLGFANDHVAAGVLGSLVQKGLVTSTVDHSGLPGIPDAYWVELA